MVSRNPVPFPAGTGAFIISPVPLTLAMALFCAILPSLICFRPNTGLPGMCSQRHRDAYEQHPRDTPTSPNKEISFFFSWKQ